MNKKEFEFILEQGEGLKIEFKEKISGLDKDIVAFSNALGGRVFLGVNDDSDVVGVNITNKFKSNLQSIARNCDPSIEVRLEKFENVLIVNVEEGKNKPYKCKEGFFMRIGANSQKMSRDEIVKMVVGEGRVRFDEMVNKDFDFERDFDEERFKLFLKENNLFMGLETKDVLVSLGLAKKEGGKLFLNNAGILFFAKEPQKFVLHAYLDCVLFKGKDKSKVIDRKTFRSGLLNQLSSAKEFVKKHLNLGYEFEGFERKEKYEIPLRAIEEALVNALMHRDYFFKGANISLFIFDDKVEVISPGGLPKGLDKKDFGKLSVRRNQVIADIFSKTPYVEQIGSGIKRMRKLVKEANLPVPKFEMNNFFRVVFRRATPKKTLKTTLKTTPKDKILAFIKQNPYITKEELAKQLNITINGVKYHIKKLRKERIIEWKGPSKGGYWEIIK